VPEPLRGPSANLHDFRTGPAGRGGQSGDRKRLNRRAALGDALGPAGADDLPNQKEIQLVPSSRTALSALTAAGLTAALAACGSSTGTAGSGPAKTTVTAVVSPSSVGMASTEHNSQDATFAADMIGHHEQAVEMAKLVPARSVNPEVVALAGRIEGAQGPEIATMKGWLTAWGLPEPENMSGMDMSDSMPGMMSPADLTELAGAKGAEFDQMFLNRMLAHHQGAITMAKTQLTAGQNPQARALAQQIITAQTAEIAQIRALLG
jgi:uncharacterized protein (DUF305 family)